MDENGYTLGELIKEFYRKHNRENTLDEVKILESWNSVVGEYIAYHTLDLRVSKGILYVKVDADSLRSELLFSKSILMDNLNRLVGYELLHGIIII